MRALHMKQLVGMNTLFLSLFMLITLFLYSQLGNAQSSERERPKGPEHLVEILELNEDQRDRFITIMKEQHQKRMEVRNLHASSRQGEKADMDALHSETLQRLNSVLTDTQLEKFEEMAKKHRPRPPLNRKEGEQKGE